jgi:signal peptidase I
VTDEEVTTSTRPYPSVADDTQETGTSPGPGGPETPATRRSKRSINRSVVEWIVLIVAAVVIALVIKQFLFQAFYIPSESMVPTLEINDRVLVNKLSYDLHDVNRGDIVVFASDPNREWKKAGIEDLVKRVIGLPGDTITECVIGRVCVNGRLLTESYLPKGTTTDLYHGVKTGGMPAEAILGCAADSPKGGCKVPAGEYFVMGDNRERSSDARDHGPIKGSSIVGRVFVRIWPLDRFGFL